MTITKVITHRGLDPDRAPYFPESSSEAFIDQLERGYGLEFDVQFSENGELIVSHDSDLNKSHLTTLPKLLELIDKKSSKESLSALHLKHGGQTPEKIDQILFALEKINPNKFIIFDTTIESAKYIKNKNPKIQIAGSVSHPYDILRYNKVVGGTLLTIEQLISNKNLFSWAWLDEWDRTDQNGKTKSLYNEETFDKLRKEKIKIALVTPELHATSPGLLGGESHPDARDRETLNKRLVEIIVLKPDAVCTDYPDNVSQIVARSS